MEPVPQVEAVAAQLSELVEGADLLGGLRAMGDLALTLVPSCVGLSLTLLLDGDPFTVTATAPRLAVLDASQYLQSGPCVDAARTGAVVDVADVAQDDERWQLFGRAALAESVRSSLSLPVVGAGGRLPGALNLYASEPHAFAACAELLASVYRVQVEDLVNDADLDFFTMESARDLPHRLEVKARVEQAVGMLGRAQALSADEARARLRSAARRSGAPVVEVADMVLATLGEPG